MATSPNLVFIWTDQQAANTLGAYGNEVVDTPNLDRLAKEGTIFERAYVTQAACSPSRSTIMTGQYPHTTGVTTNNIPLRESDKCLPEFDQLDDYRSIWIGKWHLGDEVFRQHGFDEWISTEDGYRQFYSDERDQFAHSDYHDYLIEQGYEPDTVEEDGFEWFSREYVAKEIPEEYSKTAFMAEQAKRFLRKHSDEPFILHMMFLEPHQPYTGPRDDRYSADDIELPPNFEHNGLEDQPVRIKFFREAVRRGDVTANSARDWLSSPPKKREWKELTSNYLGLVNQVDFYVGEVLEELKAQGVYNRTVTVFTSDHGEMMGSHGLIQKFNQFEESIRVPLIVRIPNHDIVRDRVKHPVSQIDLMPTVLEAMGKQPPTYLQGDSWLPYLIGQNDLNHNYVIVQRNGYTTLGIVDLTTMWTAGDRTGLDEFVPHPDDTAKEIWREMDVDRDIREVMSDPVRTIITSDGWKLNYRRAGDHELYDLSEDPYETRNLAVDDAYEKKIKELYTDILAWQRDHRDPVYLYNHQRA